MKPSEVRMWRGFMPLVDTFGRSEIEWAAALLVRTCELNGDVFTTAHPPRAIGEAMKHDRENGIEPWGKFVTNPFLRPDFRGLVEAGYAEFIGDVESGAPVKFTTKGLIVLEHAYEGRKAIDRALEIEAGAP